MHPCIDYDRVGIGIAGWLMAWSFGRHARALSLGDGGGVHHDVTIRSHDTI